MRSVSKLSAEDFKVNCLEVLEDVQSSGMEMVITKHGHPMARVVPAKTNSTTGLFGRMSQTVRIHEDLISPHGERWDAKKT